MFKKCRRCYKSVDRVNFSDGKHICNVCENVAIRKYAEKSKTSTNVKMYADDVVRQFYKGSSTALMCACRELVKHYEKNRIRLDRGLEDEKK